MKDKRKKKRKLSVVEYISAVNQAIKDIPLHPDIDVQFIAKTLLGKQKLLEFAKDLGLLNGAINKAKETNGDQKI